MQVPDNVADTLHSSLLDTQVETDKRRLVQEVSTKYRIVNRERETKQVINPSSNYLDRRDLIVTEIAGSNTEPDLSVGIMINVMFSTIVCGDP